MSKKNNDLNLLIPGENGWNIWTYSAENISLLRQTEEVNALEIEKFPTQKPLLMAFPVKELTALELWIPSQEKESVKDLVEFQVEKMGLAQTEELGVLHQSHHLQDSSDEQQSLYTIDVLKAPEEGSLPIKSPNQFSISPRCFTFAPHSMTLWKEFGKWVVAISNNDGEIVHYQASTFQDLNQDLINDSNFVIGQLIIQNIIEKAPNQIIVWVEEELARPEGFDTFESVYESKLQLSLKPEPILPKVGELLPADTRAERIAARLKKQKLILMAVVALALLAGIGYAGYSLWDLEKRAKNAQIEADRLSADNQVLIDHSTKWEELGPMVDTEDDPISLLQNVTKAIPSQNLRLTRAEFKNQLSEQEQRTLISINLTGEAKNFGDASKFDENLQKSKDLKFEWQNQSPSQTKTGWRFIYRGDKY